MLQFVTHELIVSKFRLAMECSQINSAWKMSFLLHYLFVLHYSVSCASPFLYATMFIVDLLCYLPFNIHVVAVCLCEET